MKSLIMLLLFLSSLFSAVTKIEDLTCAPDKVWVSTHNFSDNNLVTDRIVRNQDNSVCNDSPKHYFDCNGDTGWEKVYFIGESKVDNEVYCAKYYKIRQINAVVDNCGNGSHLDFNKTCVCDISTQVYDKSINSCVCPTGTEWNGDTCIKVDCAPPLGFSEFSGNISTNECSVEYLNNQLSDSSPEIFNEAVWQDCSSKCFVKTDYRNNDNNNNDNNTSNDDTATQTGEEINSSNGGGFSTGGNDSNTSSNENNDDDTENSTSGSGSNDDTGGSSSGSSISSGSGNSSSAGGGTSSSGNNGNGNNHLEFEIPTNVDELTNANSEVIKNKVTDFTNTILAKYKELHTIKVTGFGSGSCENPILDFSVLGTHFHEEIQLYDVLDKIIIVFKPLLWFFDLLGVLYIVVRDF